MRNAEIHLIKESTGIAKLKTPILKAQFPLRLSTNIDKSFESVKLQGRGSKHTLKNMAGTLNLHQYGSVKVVRSYWYLGRIPTADTKIYDEVTIRIKQAFAQGMAESRTFQTNEKSS